MTVSMHLAESLHMQYGRHPHIGKTVWAARPARRLDSAGHVGGEDLVGLRVEVLAVSVVAHGGAWVGVPGGDLHLAQVDAGVEHGGDEVCRSI
jgi:hypothetical protein